MNSLALRLRAQAPVLVRWLIHLLGSFGLVGIVLEASQSLDGGAVLIEEAGERGLMFLIASLAASQLAYYLRGSRRLWLLARRLLGLWGFGTLVVHFAAWGLHTYESPSQLLAELLDSRVLVLGAATLLTLTPLAVTSFAWFRRRLSRVAWHRLHSLVYPIVAAGLLHYYWQIKLGYALFGLLTGIAALCGAARLARRWIRAESGAGETLRRAT